MKNVLAMLLKSITACLCTSLVLAASDTIRLTGGDSNENGRLEYLYSGRWGTVCDDYFDMIDATVVCRELNLGNALNVETFRTDIIEGDLPIWLDDVECSGEERRLSNCPANRPGVHNCTHDEDIAVYCTGELHPVRLVDSSSILDSDPNGYVEIKYGTKWGTVCYDKWSDTNTDVVCKQLGYTGGSNSFGRTNYGYGDIILENVDCSGEETSLSECHQPLATHGCTNNKIIYVYCSTLERYSRQGEIRLVGGKSANEGILEIYKAGRWGTVCNENWDWEAASVACRQLGYEAVSKNLQNRYSYQLGNTELHPINVYEIDCSPTGFSNLDYCTSGNEYTSMCDHTSDVALKCQQSGKSGDLRLVGGDDSSGILEIHINGRWGTVCDIHWFEDEADVACRQLGFDVASDYSASPYDFNYDYTMAFHEYSFSCSGTEDTLLSCKDSNYVCTDYVSNMVAIRCANSTSVGVVVGVIVFIIIIVAVVGCCCCRQKRRRNTAQTTTVTAVPLSTQPGQVQQPLLQPPNQAYPAQPGLASQPGQVYPPQQAQGYPPQGGHGYPPQVGLGYPPQVGQGYPLQQSHGYPPQSGQGYQPQPGYPPPGPSHPTGQPGYPQQPGYLAETGQTLPPQPDQSYPPPTAPGYPPQSSQGYQPHLPEKGGTYPAQTYPPTQQAPPYPTDPACAIQPSAPHPEPEDLPPRYDDVATTPYPKT